MLKEQRVTLSSVVLCHSTGDLLLCTMLHHTASCCIILHHVASYCIMLHHIGLCCAAQDVSTEL